MKKEDIALAEKIIKNCNRINIREEAAINEGFLIERFYFPKRYVGFRFRKNGKDYILLHSKKAFGGKLTFITEKEKTP